MKLIEKFKSNNFGNRRSKRLLFIIIHYTALNNYKKAISYLSDPNKKVSSHYLISQNGYIYYLVDEKKRAWHAGLSYWDDFTDINSLSIGIELDYSFSKNNNKYSKKMISSLISLITNLKKKYKISNKYILGHSDIAPYRKIDPGIKFPWIKLKENNLVFFPRAQSVNKNFIVKKWLSYHNIKSKKNISILILSIIGYDVKLAKENNYYFNKLIFAYKSHYLQSKINKKLDEKTISFMVNHLINILLTK